MKVNKIMNQRFKDQMFKEYQDKVEERLGIRPLSRTEVRERDQETFAQKYKNRRSKEEVAKRLEGRLKKYKHSNIVVDLDPKDNTWVLDDSHDPYANESEMMKDRYKIPTEDAKEYVKTALKETTTKNGSGDDSVIDVDYDSIGDPPIDRSLNAKYVSDMSEEELNNLTGANEREMPFGVGTREGGVLDQMVTTLVDWNEQARQKHPNRYTDFDCLIDWMAKIKDRLE